MNVLGLTGGEIIEIVEETVSLFSQIPEMEMKDCGYFTLRDNMTGRVILLAQIGVCPSNKAIKYCTLSLEKSQRLFSRTDDRSSFQSRSPDGYVSLGSVATGYSETSETSFQWGHWGGAIRLNIGEGSIILSFSGLPELGDEAVMLAVAVQTGWLKIYRAMEIAKISENKYFFPLMEMFNTNLFLIEFVSN